MRYALLMQRTISGVVLLASLVCAQTPEFEVASIRPAAEAGFRLSPDTGSGGPGTPDPAMFRCRACMLSSLITRAYGLTNYQFPGQNSLPPGAFEVAARIPRGTTEPEFQQMLQHLLKDRFGLVAHFEARTLRGYHLIAINGGKLAQSTSQAKSAEHDNHGWGGGDHNHNGQVLMFGSARYRAEEQTIGDFARVISDQLSLPVDDRTGLNGRYDISLTWAGDGSHGHSAFGNEFHDQHASTAPDTDSGPTLFEALQSQLGLKLVQADVVATQVLIVDHVERQPTAN